jgi:SAM-dependent methyltransferase
MSAFDRLIEEAELRPFSGWDFSYLHGRMEDGELTWDYTDLVRRHFPPTGGVLDLGTGGGERLAALAPLPPGTVATEAYPPNVPIAQARLAPLGVEVVAVQAAPDNTAIAPGDGVGSLPFAGQSFPLVIARHESYYPAEVYRILTPGGTFLTQQVGGEHHRDLNALLGAPPAGYDPLWTLEFAVAQVEQAGLRVVAGREELPETVFRDIGALVYYLKAAPWQVPGFGVTAYRERLAALHERIEREGGLRIRGHFFYLEAVKP